ncbi:MAG: ATP-binding protein [Verrucomicrobiota bacterium]
MPWLLTCAAIIAVVAVHLQWRRKLSLLAEASRAEKQAQQAEYERQLLEAKTRQATLFDSMIEGLVLLDEHGRIQLANHAFSRLFQLPDNITAKTLLEVLRQHELTELLARVAREKQVDGFELRLGGLNERFLQINAAVIAGPEGKAHTTLLVFHDLTRLKQLEGTREEFVANVSHELRTPLSLIRGYVETLLDGAKDNPEVSTKFLETIQRNAGRLQFLIEDLLTISALESGRMKMNLQPVQLGPLVDRVFEDFRSQAAARSVTLANTVPELAAQADADRLQQVLGNLVGNAIKYGRINGRVTVSAQPTESMLEVCVRDDGPGIPAEALGRVFERFYRVDKARSRDQGGTGLGLSIVKHLVQGHGGKVWAESEPGQGAAFYFTIPVAEQTESKG